MGWYDFFSRFYDRSLERHYLGARAAACKALQLREGLSVLDLPCGTGQSFDGICAEIGSRGRLIGVDLSSGMLNKAAQRAARQSLTQVSTLHCGVDELDEKAIAGLNEGETQVDRIHVFLGLTAFPDVEQAYASLWPLLKPGGRFVVVDVYAAKPDFQGKMVNLVARADIRRRVWEGLEARAQGYAFAELPSTKDHGGQLFVASGDKAAS